MTALTGELDVAELHRKWTQANEGPGENDLSLSQLWWHRGHLNTLLRNADVSLEGVSHVPNERTEVLDWFEDNRATIGSVIRDAHASDDLVAVHPTFHGDH